MNNCIDAIANSSELANLMVKFRQHPLSTPLTAPRVTSPRHGTPVIIMVPPLKLFLWPLSNFFDALLKIQRPPLEKSRTEDEFLCSKLFPR